MECDNLIKADIKRNCAEPITQGVERVAYIVNQAHVDFGSIEFVEGSWNQSTNLPLVKGTKAYEIIQYSTKPFEGLKIDLATGKVGGSASTEFPFIIPDNSPDVCENIIDPMLDGGAYLIIWENRHKNLRTEDEKVKGASTFQMAGFFQGLTLSAGSCEKYSDDTRSGWAITLKEEGAPRSAMFLNAGGVEATRTLIKTLLAPVAEA